MLSICALKAHSNEISNLSLPSVCCCLFEYGLYLFYQPVVSFRKRIGKTIPEIFIPNEGGIEIFICARTECIIVATFAAGK